MNTRPPRLACSVNVEVDCSQRTILVAELNASTGGDLVDQFRADGYRAVLAHTPEHARSLARSRPIRAVVIGALEAPRGQLELLEEIRGGSDGTFWDQHLPTIMLCVAADQLDLLRAFEAGVDDFIATEGSVYLELRARLRAVLRRAEIDFSTRLLRVGALEIDTGAHEVRFAGVPVQLCRLEYQLLIHLARNPSAVCPKRELLSAIWNQNAGQVRTVDSHASRLRRKLGAVGARGMVVNVWGVGYRLI